MKRVLVLLFAVVVNAFLLVRTLFWTVPSLLLKLRSGGRTRRPDGAEARPTASRPYATMLSFVEWDGAWQRPQHLATLLAPRLPVVYCAPVRAHNAMGRIAQLLFSARRQEGEGLVVLRPLVLPGENRFRAIALLNDLTVTAALRREMRRRGGAPRVLMTNSPLFERVFSCLPGQVRVYDAMDELVRLPWAPAGAAERERRLAAQCDLVTTGTLALERLKRREFGSACPEMHYVACGVDAAHFAPRPEVQPAPDDIAHLPRPILGFFGALNERLDPEILEALADRWPEASVVLVGPVYRAFGEAARRLRARRNVHFLGSKPYGDLPRYLASFDCALVPYRLTGGIEFGQPVKVLEYLAGGKPVVSTRIPDVVELYEGLVRTAGTPEAFVAMAREAVAEGKARAEEYVGAVQGRSWEAMAREFERLFNESAARKAASPRRVAHLLHGAHLGGAEELVMNLCRHYDAERYRGIVICLGMGETVRKRLEERRVEYRIVPMKSRGDLGVALRLIDVLRAEKIDLLHTHTGRTNLVGRIASRIAGLRVVTTVHTAVARDVNDFGRGNRVNAWVERLTQGVSARLICVSEHNRREILERGGIEAARVLRIPNGVEAAVPALSDETRSRLWRELDLGGGAERIVGMVASMRPRKGPELLLRAVAMLAKKHADLRLLMVGPGEFVESRDYLAMLKDLARELGIANRVVFTGHRGDVAEVLSLMEVVVLPSLFGEGMPLVLLEAMAQGKPLVASRTEGNDEVVVHGVNGFLAASGDAESLAMQIGLLLDDPEAACAMGRRGREAFEARYRIEAVAEQYERVYDQVLGLESVQPYRAKAIS